MNRLPTIIIIFAASLLIGVFLVWPKYQELKIKKTEVVQKEAELENIKEYGRGLRSLSEELEKKSDEISKINTALPARFSLLSFLNYLQKTVSENGLTLKNYGAAEPSDKKEQEGIKEFKTNLQVSGSYNSFKNLLLTFERSSRLIEVEKISFSAPEKEKAGDFSIELKVYSY